MSKLLQLRKIDIYLIVLIFFPLLIVLPYLNGYWRLADDAYDSTLVIWRYQQRVLGLGEWPYWSSNEGIGKPLSLSIGTGIFFPLQLLWGQIMGWTDRSYVVFITLLLFIGELSAYGFIRILGYSKRTALFFAVAFVGNGFIISYFSNPYVIIPILFWPLLGIFLVRIIKEENFVLNLKNAVLLAFSLVLIETGGYPLTKLFIYLATFFIYLAYTKEHSSKFKIYKFKALLVAALLSLLISSPSVVSQFDLIKYADRTHDDIYKDYTHGSPSNLFTLGTMLIPLQFLARDTVQIGTGWLERSWWIGTITLLLFSFWPLKYSFLVKKTKFLILIALLFFLFSLGGHSFFREMISFFVPIFNSLRMSSMARVIPMIYLIFAATLVFNSFANKSSDLKLRKYNFRNSAAKIPLDFASLRARYLTFKERGIYLLILSVFLYLGVSAYFAYQIRELKIDSIDLFLIKETGVRYEIMQVLFYILSATVIILNRALFYKKRSWVVVALFLHCLNLADFSYGFRRVVAKEVSPEKRSEFVMNNAPDFELSKKQDNERSIKIIGEGEEWRSWDGNDKALYAYHPPYHNDLWNAVRSPKTYPKLGKLVDCIGSLEEGLGKKDNYPSMSEGSPRDFEHSTLNIQGYSCEGQSFVIERWFGNKIIVSGSGPSSAMIGIHDLYMRGWKAKINGVSTPIYKVYDYLKGVIVPGGGISWKIELEYKERFFPTLWYVSIIGVALSLLALVISFRFQQKADK